MRTLVNQAKTASKPLLTEAKIIRFSFAFPDFVEIDNKAHKIKVNLLDRKAPHVSLSVYPAKLWTYNIRVKSVNAGDVGAIAKWPAEAEKLLSTWYEPKNNLWNRLKSIANLKILDLNYTDESFEEKM